MQNAELAGVDLATVMAMDPACGGGVFLSPIAQRIKSALIDAG